MGKSCSRPTADGIRGPDDAPTSRRVPSPAVERRDPGPLQRVRSHMAGWARSPVLAVRAAATRARGRTRGSANGNRADRRDRERKEEVDGQSARPSVTQILHRVGFHNPSHFTTTFRRNGVSPTVYRRRCHFEWNVNRVQSRPRSAGAPARAAPHEVGRNDADPARPPDRGSRRRGGVRYDRTVRCR